MTCNNGSLGDRTQTRGTTGTFSISFKNSVGTPIDISGYTVWFTVRDSIPATSVHDDTDAIISKRVEISAGAGASGIVSIPVSPSDTNIELGTYYYDIQYKDSNNNIYSTNIYKYKITGDITRSS